MCPWHPFHEWFFNHNSNFMKISCTCYSNSGQPIAIDFRTCHGNACVVSCTKSCSNSGIIIWIKSQVKVPPYLNYGGKIFSEIFPWTSWASHILLTQTWCSCQGYLSVARSTNKNGETFMIYGWNFLWVLFPVNSYGNNNFLWEKIVVFHGLVADRRKQWPWCGGVPEISVVLVVVFSKWRVFRILAGHLAWLGKQLGRAFLEIALPHNLE